MTITRASERVDVGDGYVSLTHYGSDTGARCLLAPPFSIPARYLEFVAAALTRNGWAVSTFDPRHHVGCGSGDIVDFTMSSYVDDCTTVMGHVRPSLTVGVSLGARAVARALGQGAPSQTAILLTPVVDLASTITTILGVDVFSGPPDRLPNTMSIVGVDVKARNFVTDSLDHDLTGIERTTADLAAYAGDVTFIAGTHDPWVGIGDVHLVANDSAVDTGARSVRAVAADSHTLSESPDLALRLVGALLDEAALLGRRVGV